jgi:UPF0716 protein FxsA
VGFLALAFIVVPIIDLWLLLSIGDVLGFWPTLGLTVGVAVLGGYLGKREGLKVLSGWKRAVGELRVPEEGLLSGALVLVGAALLIAPGVLTDVLGLALLFPPTRRLVARVVQARIAAKMQRATEEGRLKVRFVSFGGASFAPQPETIDAEGEVVEEAPARLLSAPPKASTD